MRWAGNSIEFHGGETAGYNLFVGDDRANDLTIVIWTNLTLAIDDAAPNANFLMLRVLDQIYQVSPFATVPSATTAMSTG